MKNKINKMKGFTLVELLIVIALIAILSVAVLATINPIEQSNKARDARVQNDAAEVMNAYERFYASTETYPWMGFADALTVNAAVALRSDANGFGICSSAATQAALVLLNATSASTVCDSNGPIPGYNFLISSSELKNSFIGKDEFAPVIATPPKLEQALWTLKKVNSSSIYICYIPKAGANRIIAAKMRCITTTAGASQGTVSPIGGACLATTGATVWTVPVTDGTSAMFRCVPE